MKRLPVLLIVACVLLLVMSMSALSQTSVPVRNATDATSSQKTDLPKLIVRSAARGSWAAVRYASGNVILPVTTYVTEVAVTDVGPKVASAAFRTLSSAAKESAHLGRLGLDRVRAKLRQ